MEAEEAVGEEVEDEPGSGAEDSTIQTIPGEARARMGSRPSKRLHLTRGFRLDMFRRIFPDPPVWSRNWTNESWWSCGMDAI